MLSVAFLLAALSSLHLSGTITRTACTPATAKEIRIQPGQTVAPLPKPGARTIGRGTQAGVVYRLANGSSSTSRTPRARKTP